MKISVLTIFLWAACICGSQAQEVTIGGFPLGVGNSVSPEFWDAHSAALQDVADALKEHPEARAIITGRADGTPYAEHNDAKNPGLSLGRAHALRNVLVNRFGVDSTRLFVQSIDVAEIGEEYRSVSVRVEIPKPTEVVQPPPVVVAEPTPPPPAPVVNNYYDEDGMVVRLGIGASTSPFGSAIPMITGSLIWKRTLGFSVILGHTFWDETYEFKGQSLDTWQRMLGGALTYYPWKDKPVGFVGGWLRIEEISQTYYEYVHLSEGPALGVTVSPVKHVSLTGLYNPSRQRFEGTDFSAGKNGQFLFGVSVWTDFGGGGR